MRLTPPAEARAFAGGLKRAGAVAGAVTAVITVAAGGRSGIVERAGAVAGAVTAVITVAAGGRSGIVDDRVWVEARMDAVA